MTRSWLSKFTLLTLLCFGCSSNSNDPTQLLGLWRDETGFMRVEFFEDGTYAGRDGKKHAWKLLDEDGYILMDDLRTAFTMQNDTLILMPEPQKGLRLQGQTFRRYTEHELKSYRQDRQITYALHQASSSGDVNALKALLDKGAYVNTVSEGYSPLFLAIHDGHTEAVRLLLERGANPNLTDINSGHRAALHFASEYNRTEIAKILLVHGADLHRKTKYTGETPLVMAVVRRHFELAEMLLEKGANINDQNAEGNTALHVAASRYDNVTTKFLLDHGANVNLKNKWEKTPLGQLSERERVAEAAKLLVAAGATE